VLANVADQKSRWFRRVKRSDAVRCQQKRNADLRETIAAALGDHDGSVAKPPGRRALYRQRILRPRRPV